MSEWQGHKLSSSGQLRNSDSLPPLNRPYPGQAVWLLAHGGCHVEDHHIDLKAIAPKMHWKLCGNHGWCMSQMANYFVNINRNWILYERRPGHRDIFPPAPSLPPPTSPSKKVKRKPWLSFLSALNIQFWSSSKLLVFSTDGCSIVDVVLLKWDGWEWMVSGRGEVKSTIRRL